MHGQRRVCGRGGRAGHGAHRLAAGRAAGGPRLAAVLRWPRSRCRRGRQLLLQLILLRRAAAVQPALPLGLLLPQHQLVQPPVVVDLPPHLRGGRPRVRPVSLLALLVPAGWPAGPAPCQQPKHMQACLLQAALSASVGTPTPAAAATASCRPPHTQLPRARTLVMSQITVLPSVVMMSVTSCLRRCSLMPSHTGRPFSVTLSTNATRPRYVHTCGQAHRGTAHWPANIQGPSFCANQGWAKAARLPQLRLAARALQQRGPAPSCTALTAAERTLQPLWVSSCVTSASSPGRSWPARSNTVVSMRSISSHSSAAAHTQPGCRRGEAGSSSGCAQLLTSPQPNQRPLSLAGTMHAQRALPAPGAPPFTATSSSCRIHTLSICTGGGAWGGVLGSEPPPLSTPESPPQAGCHLTTQGKAPGERRAHLLDAVQLLGVAHFLPAGLAEPKHCSRRAGGHTCRGPSATAPPLLGACQAHATQARGVACSAAALWGCRTGTRAHHPQTTRRPS